MGRRPGLRRLSIGKENCQRRFRFAVAFEQAAEFPLCPSHAVGGEELKAVAEPVELRFPWRGIPAAEFGAIDRCSVQRLQSAIGANQRTMRS